MKYLRVLDLPADSPLPVSDTLAEWIAVDDLFQQELSPLAIETPTGDADGVNAVFVFVGTPLAILRNGLEQSADGYTITDGHTVTFNDPPPSGSTITGVVLKAERWEWPA